jgi:hypothetical protein
MSNSALLVPPVPGDLNEARPLHGFHRGGGTTLGVSGEESSSAESARGSKSREEE